MIDKIPREQLNKARQYAAILTAFTLPISTSGTAISVALLVVLTLLTAPRDQWQSILRLPSSILPVALFVLILVSMLWSLQPFGPGGTSHYVKLLVIPVLLAGSYTSAEATQIGRAFAAACIVLMVLSIASLAWPTGPWGWFKGPGVPVKDNAVQTASFAICAFGLALYAVHYLKANDKLRGLFNAALAILLFANIFLISLSKTGIFVLAAFVGLFLTNIDGWRHRIAIAISLVLIAFISMVSSGEAQRRIDEINIDVRALSRSNSMPEAASTKAVQVAPLEASPSPTPNFFSPSVSGAIGPSSNPTQSTASRIDFWRKALGFVRQAPLVGHGAGSTKSLYDALEKENPSPYGEGVPDPHNQLLAVAIQTGLIGSALLLTVWISHFVLFLGHDIPHRLGQAIVIQNVLSSLFNSSLSQVTQGTLYCFAIGVLGSLVRQHNLSNQNRTSAA